MLAALTGPLGPKHVLTRIPSRSCLVQKRHLSEQSAASSVSGTQRSKSPLQAPRGMHDCFGLEQRKRQHVVDTCRSVAAVYGYEEIATPLVEEEGVFSRTLGGDSDVVSKEMYSFSDRSKNLLALRPEGTAGVVRAAINHKNQLGNKLFYSGPMFRYERPQKGRSRQFHQFGVEHMNSPSPLCDVHVIEMADTILKRLKIENYELQLNSLGDATSRSNYRQVLESYLNKHKDSLSPLSKSRLERGSVLRVLDSKEENDQSIIEAAPTLDHHLTSASSSRFEQVRQGLDAIGLKYTLNPRLVRGLDYYNDTCFEFVTTGGNAALGQAIVAGGRYDKLSEFMGGQAMAGVGWAAGIERLVLLLSDSMLPPLPRPIAIIPVSNSDSVDDMWKHALQLTHQLRSNGIASLLSYENTPGKHTKKAAKENCKYSVFIGSDDLAKGTVVVKDMDTGNQVDVPLSSVLDYFSKRL